MKFALLAAAVFALAAHSASAAQPACAADAVAQARKLLVFHRGADDRMQIDPEVKERPALRNPANRTQQFQVLEVWGSVYKGSYRMRMIYFPSGGSCLLMGQEILEQASL